MNKDVIKDNMSDLEIRVLGAKPEGGRVAEKEQGKDGKVNCRRRLPGMIAALLLLLAAVVCVWVFMRCNASFHGNGGDGVMVSDSMSQETLKDSTNAGPSYVMVADTTINDIPLRVLIPVGGHMELYVGHNPAEDSNVILAAHAADLRDDDGTPAGAFVHKGELLAKGHSKYGFCAIVEGMVSIGRQIETPLFERAIEQNGSFFRQYSIVSNGKMMAIPPKGKAQRRALCLKDNAFQIIESVTPESYHDFSLALEDYGVSEALALVGSNAAVMWRNEKGEMQQNGDIFGKSYPLENYIVWRRE